jgi:hypothetical protein
MIVEQFERENLQFWERGLGLSGNISDEAAELGILDTDSAESEHFGEYHAAYFKVGATLAEDIESFLAVTTLLVSWLNKKFVFKALVSWEARTYWPTLHLYSIDREQIADFSDEIWDTLLNDDRLYLRRLPFEILIFSH